MLSRAAEAAEEEPAGFWAEVGIDTIKIVTAEAEYYTLRCYLDDEPLFLGSNGTIETLRSFRALTKFIADEDGGDHDLAGVSTWADVVAKATAGELKVKVSPDNTYVLTGLADDLEALRAEDSDHPVAYDRMVIGDHDPDLSHAGPRGSAGMLAETAVPAPGADSRVKVPASSSGSASNQLPPASSTGAMAG